MRRRSVVAGLGLAPFACLCTPASGQGRRIICQFQPPPRPAAGGIHPLYTIKDRGGRGKSQLTWSFNGSMPQFANIPATLKLAFGAWSAPNAAPALSFRQIGGGADINITAVAFKDGAGKPDPTTLGSTADDGSTIKFNTVGNWAGTTLQHVATHEIGHALGLLHSAVDGAMMAPFASVQPNLAPDDRAAIHAVYGWSAQAKLQGGSANGPALCACGNTLAMAWRGTGNDDNIWFATSTDGLNWTPQRKIAGAASALAGPSLAWDGARLWMAWSGAKGDDSLYWANTGNFFNGNWTGVQHLGDRSSSHTPRIAIAAGGPVMTWKGGRDSGLYWSRFNGSWNGQQKIGGVGSAAGPGMCQDLDPSAVRMVWRGAGDDTSVYTSTLSGNTWAPQQQVRWVIPGNGANTNAGAGGPGSTEGPCVAFVGGRVVMLWRGAKNDSGLWFTQLANDVIGGRTVTEWSSQANVPGVGSAAAPAIDGFGGLLRAAWRGTNNDDGLWTAGL